MSERRRNLLITIGIVVLVAGSWLWWKREQAQAARAAQAAQAWANAKHCLIGAPLGAQESLKARVRAIELGDEPRDGTAGWPHRCAADIALLYRELGDGDYGSAMRRELVERFSCNEGCVIEDVATQLVGLDVAAAAVPLATVQPTVRAPKLSTTLPVAKERFGKLAPRGTKVVGRAVSPAGRVRFAFVGATAQATRCELDLSSDSAPQCTAMSPDKAADVGFDEPLVDAAALEELLSERRIDIPKRLTLCRHDNRVAVLFRSDDGTPSAMAIHDGEAWAFHSHKAPSEKPAQPENSAAAKAAAKAAVRDAHEFGMIGLLEGQKASSDPSPWDAATAAGAKANKDMFGERIAKAAEDAIATRPHKPDQSLTCNAKAATVSWRSATANGSTIHQLSCDDGGCRKSTTSLQVAVKAWWLTAKLNDKTLAVWRHPSGLVHMLHAPLAELSKAQSRVLIDSKEYGGPATEQLEVFAHDNSAVMLFRSDGYHGLRIDADGSFAAYPPSTSGQR